MHAAFFPILEVMTWASSVASKVLPGKPRSDLELAFRNEGRSAFTWLQAMLAAETPWCLGEGCSVCVVERAFESEPNIRLLSLACRIYQFLGKTMLSRIAASLPSFDFLHEALAAAVKKDSFWGPEYWDIADDKAANMELCVTQMVAQALDHQARLEEAANGKDKKGKAPVTGGSVEHDDDRSETSIPILPSPLAKQQLEMGKEERERLTKLAAEKGIAAFSGNSQDGFRFHHRRRSRVATIIGPSTKPKV